MVTIALDVMFNVWLAAGFAMFLLDIEALNTVVPVPVKVIFPVPKLQVVEITQPSAIFISQFVFIEGQVHDDEEFTR